MLFQAGQRTRTMRGPTERGWDIDGLELSREFMDECAGMDFLEMVKGYDKPVLLIHGTGDVDIPVESAYALKKVYGGQLRAGYRRGSQPPLPLSAVEEARLRKDSRLFEKQLG